MAEVTIQSELQTPEWPWGGTEAYLRIYASQDFYAADGTQITGGQVGSPSFYQQYTCTIDGNDFLTIPQVTLHSTLDSSVENVTYTAVFYDSAGRQRNFKLSNFVVSEDLAPATTWLALTLANQGTILNFFNETWTVEQIIQYIDTRIGLGTTPFASSLVYGKTSLSEDPVLASEPIAIADNDTRVQPATTTTNGVGRPDVAPANPAIPIYAGINSPQITKNTKVLNDDYANSLSGAIASIGATPTTLVIKDAVSTNTATVPSTLILRFEDGAKITINSGQTLTIGKMEDPGNVQCFVQADATANVRFGIGAVEKINVAWFVGATPTLCTNAINQAIGSITTNGGGTLKIPGEGTWTTAGNHIVADGMVIEGDNQATVLRMTSNNLGIFKQGEDIYDVKVKDITLDGNNGTTTGVVGYLFSGTTPGTGSGETRFENVQFNDCATGVELLDTGGTSWQIKNVSVDAKCRFLNNTTAFKCNTSNNVLECGAYIVVANGQSIADVTAFGQWRFSGEHAGTAPDGDNQVVSTTVLAAAGCTANGTAQAVVQAAGMLAAPQTSGLLDIGRTYIITAYQAGDDFSNVDGPVTGTVNTTGYVFTATGTTPTTWTNSSSLKEVALVPVILTTADNTAAKVTTRFRRALAGDPAITSFFHIGGTDGTANFTNDDITLIALDPAANDTTMNVMVLTGTATGIIDDTTANIVVPGVANTISAQGFVIDGAHGVLHLDNVVTEAFGEEYITIGTGSDLNSEIVLTGCSIQDPIRLKYARSVTVTGGTMSDRVIRDGEGGSIVQVFGTRIPTLTYFNGLDAFVPLTGTRFTNFGGSTYGAGTGSVGFATDSGDAMNVAQDTIRAAFNENQALIDVRQTPLQAMYSSTAAGSSSDRGMLFIGSCTEGLEPLFGYSLRRDVTDGRLKIVCNQTGLGVDLVSMNLSVGGGAVLTTTDATGTGNLVKATSPTLVTPALGTPTALVGTNITGTAASLTAGNATNLTGMTATVAELNQLNDVSAYQETISGAGALSVTKIYSKLELPGAGAVTLAVPDASMLGQTKVIEMTVDNGDVTLSLANCEGGTAGTTCTWNDVGDKLIVIAGVNKWTIIKEFGVALT